MSTSCKRAISFGHLHQRKTLSNSNSVLWRGSKSYPLNKAIKNEIIDINDLGKIVISIVNLQDVHEAG